MFEHQQDEYDLRTNLIGESSVRAYNHLTAHNVSKHTPIFEYEKYGIRNIIFFDYYFKKIDFRDLIYVNASENRTLLNGHAHYFCSNFVARAGNGISVPEIGVNAEIVLAFRVYNIAKGDIVFKKLNLGSPDHKPLLKAICLKCRHTIEDMIDGSGFDFAIDSNVIVDIIKAKIPTQDMSRSLFISAKFGNETIKIKKSSENEAMSIAKGDDKNVHPMDRAKELVEEHRKCQASYKHDFGTTLVKATSVLMRAHECLELVHAPSFSSNVDDSVNACVDYFFARNNIERNVRYGYRVCHNKKDFDQLNFNEIFSYTKLSDWNCLRYVISKNVEELYPDSNLREGDSITTRFEFGNYTSQSNALARLFYPGGFNDIDDIKTFANDIINMTISQNSPIPEFTTAPPEQHENIKIKFKVETFFRVNKVRVINDNELIIIGSFDAGRTQFLKYFRLLYGEFIFNSCFTDVRYISDKALAAYKADGIYADSDLWSEVDKANRNELIV